MDTPMGTRNSEDTMEHEARIAARAAKRQARRQEQRGGSLVEAGLVTALVYAPFLVGLVVLGFATINRIQLDQITRDVGIMHARGVDFNATKSKEMFLKLTQGTPFRTGSGDETAYNGTMIISTIRMLGTTDCPSGCSNMGMPVVTYRVVLGNSTLHNSQFASPSNIDSATGRVNNYKNDASALATGFVTVLSGMQAGDEAYVAEGYMITPGLSFPDFNAESESTSLAIF